MTRNGGTEDAFCGFENWCDEPVESWMKWSGFMEGTDFRRVAPYWQFTSGNFQTIAVRERWQFEEMIPPVEILRNVDGFQRASTMFYECLDSSLAGCT